jgi:hypothetical protein
MGNSFGKIDDVALSHMEHLVPTIYFPFPGFDQKRFIGCMMNVQRGHIARRSEKPQHAKGVTRLFRTYQNVSFLAKLARMTRLLSTSSESVPIFSFMLLQKQILLWPQEFCSHYCPGLVIISDTNQAESFAGTYSQGPRTAARLRAGYFVAGPLQWRASSSTRVGMLFTVRHLTLDASYYACAEHSLSIQAASQRSSFDKCTARWTNGRSTGNLNPLLLVSHDQSERQTAKMVWQSLKCSEHNKSRDRNQDQENDCSMHVCL